MIHFVTTRAGDFGIRDFVELHAPALGPDLDVLYYEDLPTRRTTPSGTYIFSALDQLTLGGRQLVGELAEQLEQPASECRVLNDPRRVMLRFELLEALSREGLNRHRAARICGVRQPLRFPVFLREEWQHTGSLSPLLYGEADLERAIGGAVLRGHRLADLLIVEFCDTSDANARYRRYAAFVVGTNVIARELVIGRDWMLKGDSNDSTEQELLEERAFVLGNPHAHTLQQLFALGGVEYGRIDYAIRDGAVETWEINLNPTIRRGRRPDANPLPPALSGMREPGRLHFTSALEAALRAVDSCIPPRPVTVQYSDAGLRHATPTVRSSGRAWFHPIASMLRPAAPLLRGVMDSVSPYVARVARRFT
jgi:hypothetical protein